MKIFIASATLCGLLAASVFAAEQKEAAPAPQEKTAPAPKPKAEKPRILNLEQPQPQTRAQPFQAAPGTAPQTALNGGQPASPPTAPGFTFTPGAGEEAGPPITLHPGTAPLAPGIYVARPYTGIVVVPPLIDPKMVKGLPKTRDVMPSPAPELRLTPKEK